MLSLQSEFKKISFEIKRVRGFTEKPEKRFVLRMSVEKLFIINDLKHAKFVPRSTDFNHKISVLIVVSNSLKFKRKKKGLGSVLFPPLSAIETPDCIFEHA